MLLAFVGFQLYRSFVRALTLLLFIDQTPLFKTVKIIQNIIKILVEQSFSTALSRDRLLNDL